MYVIVDLSIYAGSETCSTLSSGDFLPSLILHLQLLEVLKFRAQINYGFALLLSLLFSKDMVFRMIGKCGRG